MAKHALPHATCPSHAACLPHEGCLPLVTCSVVIHFTHVTPLNPECINCLSLWIKLSIA